VRGESSSTGVPGFACCEEVTENDPVGTRRKIPTGAHGSMCKVRQLAGCWGQGRHQPNSNYRSVIPSTLAKFSTSILDPFNA
jgi:hypothetical protein